MFNISSDQTLELTFVLQEKMNATDKQLVPFEKPDKPARITKYFITNVTALASVSAPIELRTLLERVKNVSFNPARCRACVFRFNDPPRLTILFFRTGKLIITGSRDLATVDSAAKFAVRLLNRLGIVCALETFRVTNVSAAGAFKASVDLQRLQETFEKYAFRENSTTEEENEERRLKRFFDKVRVEGQSERFTGLVVKHKDPFCSVTVFVNGKFVLTGLKSKEEVAVVVENITRIAEFFFIE